MAVDYKKYLAENVLSERRTVTYRLLSRALRVHCNLAKQMLFDFHQTENAKKTNSVTATYLISGFQVPQSESARNGRLHDGEDVAMQSSPYMSSMPQSDETEHSPRTTSFVLAREEDLDDAKDTFESISTIYVYSVQSTTLQDLNVLGDVSEEILTTFGNEDVLELSKQWGMIQNENVRRRKSARPPPPMIVAPPTKVKAPKKENVQPKPQIAPESAPSSKESTQRMETKTAEKAPVRGKKGDLFSSFAKAKPKLKSEDSVASSANLKEDTSQKGMFDGDDDEDDEAEENLFSNSEHKSGSTRESRKEREAKLMQMMEDDDDDDMPDASDVPIESATEDPDPEPEPEPEPKEVVTVQGGRRRGKRKIMKKKTVKDEEGYLVTVEEPAWESFSEDEPAPPPKKKAAVSATGKKAGQGNIMSFFSKK